jgi:hypothetical protein
MKIFIISLILINGKLLKQEIYEPCEIWWQNNVKVHERKIYFKKQNHYYHTYKGQEVFGYHCREYNSKMD